MRVEDLLGDAVLLFKDCEKDVRWFAESGARGVLQGEPFVAWAGVYTLRGLVLTLRETRIGVAVAASSFFSVGASASLALISIGSMASVLSCASPLGPSAVALRAGSQSC